MAAPGTPIEIHLISDSTGDTAARVARAAQTQFSGHRTTVVRHPRVTTVDDLASHYGRVASRGGVVIFYTLVDRTLRRMLEELCQRDGMPCCDLLGPPLEALAAAAGHEADLAPGRPIGLDADYFRRIAAMEFVVKHDDGLNGEGLEDADIVLIGVSRTGKTPLSMYLGFQGYKTANVPLVRGIEPPGKLFQIDRAVIVGLTIEAERLAQIRGRRMGTLAGAHGRDGYAELNRIHEELEQATALQRRLSCPVLDVSNLAVEEAAVRVIELVEAPGGMTEAYVYAFADAADVPRELLGGKGAGLADMTRLGLPVPDGFTITTAACVHAMHSGGEWPAGLQEQIDAAVAALEERCGRRLGDDAAPLLVSVRSGAAVSMPGMMETILNLGLNDAAASALAEETGDARFAYDSYRRLLQMFGEVVAGVGAHVFEHALTRRKAEQGVKLDTGLSGDDLRGLCTEFKRLYLEGSGREFPQAPHDQLQLAISAVFRSWGAPRAHVYRRAHDISDDLGTAANICQMVFGNRGEGSGTGVCFSRNPATGERRLYGEFLENAQGEDVVAGIRTPEPIERMRELLPAAYDELAATVERLEQHHREVQDIEFTVEQGRLYMLQSRTAKRTAQAALRIVREFVAEGVITPDEAVLRIDPSQLDQLLHPRLDSSVEIQPIARGLGASPGAAVGAAVFDADSAAARGAAGEAVVLVRWETTPDDIHGLIQAQGVVTSHGGMTSHAAVVARGMGKPCVAGVDSAQIDEVARTLTVGDIVVHEGDLITIDGAAGTLMLGALPLVAAELGEDFAAIAAWADERRRLRVRANADTPEDARRARELGAEGIGLCRTEHMFMAADRLPVVREMILASEDAEREAALARLLPMQQSDFEAIFAAMAGLPVTVRLLDPPLHEFLPDRTALAVELALAAPGPERTRLERLAERVRQLSEQNPMLGTRGCRLALLHPGIYAMQVRAIVRGALAAAARGEAAQIEIMIPLVAFAEELRRMRALVEEAVADELERAGRELEISIGTMIELPRAALRAAEIAEHADFFSFGTNDLTQTTLGFSRDDAESAFLATYLDAGVIERNPFAGIDVDGVGELVRIGAERGRAAKPGLKLGICGEHGGDPASVTFFHAAGLDYVSCSPFRVPIARLAAARAALGATDDGR